MTADVLLTNVKWANGDRAFLHAPGCPDLSLSQPLLFGGEPDRWSPEELMTGAVEADVRMTFLQFIKPRHFNRFLKSADRNRNRHAGGCKPFLRPRVFPAA
jgi:hypothetical protein